MMRRGGGEGAVPGRGIAFLGRIVFGLASILATLEAEGDFREALA